MRFSSMIAAACCVVLSLASCGGDNKGTTPNATVDVNASATVPSSSAPSSSSPVTDVFPTQPLPCQSVPVPATPLKSPAPSGAVLLTNVQRKGDSCVDHVVFEFTSKTSDPPGYTITYGTPPFAQDGSGKRVAIKGSAFIVVKVRDLLGEHRQQHDLFVQRLVVLETVEQGVRNDAAMAVHEDCGAGHAHGRMSTQRFHEVLG